MPERIVYIDDIAYHADDDGVLLFDEDGDPILSHICICFAHNANACSCGAWDRPLPGDEEW